MADLFPLLVFPPPKSVKLLPKKPKPLSQPYFPEHGRQKQRLALQTEKLKNDFAHLKASFSGVLAGMEPETVLVIEIVGSIKDFKQSVESTPGLEWLGEWELKDIEPSQDFFIFPKIRPKFFKTIPGLSPEDAKALYEHFKQSGLINKKDELTTKSISEISLPIAMEPFRLIIAEKINEAKKKLLSGRMFLSMGNESGLNEILTLWRDWSSKKKLPYGRSAWKDVFNQTLEIRRWGINETLEETGMLERWRDFVKHGPIDPYRNISCQIELFYRRSLDKRKANEAAVKRLLDEIGGKIIGIAIDKPEIGLHAIKLNLLEGQIQNLVEALERSDEELEIKLFKYPGIMYFRPTGQSLGFFHEGEGESHHFPDSTVTPSPIVAILDGVPNLAHKALRDRILIDDPDNLSSLYQPGEKIHGTCMASLVIYGDLSREIYEPLTRQIYLAPILQPNTSGRSFGVKEEHLPEDVFFEDRVERSVRRMFEGEGNTPAQAPNVKIINLSIGDPDQHFIRSPSSWAKLLDWLSWKYRILFCVSAGNFLEGIRLGINSQDFADLPDDQKTLVVFRAFNQQLHNRRIIAPGESINGITVGALHQDESREYFAKGRIEILPLEGCTSPISRIGFGFRGSIKPEIFLPGGRQLYKMPRGNDPNLYPNTIPQAPGQKVACDSSSEGDLTKTLFTCGTSNAAALATRHSAQIYDVLSELRDENGDPIRDNLMAVMIKTLLVHGSQPLPQTEAAVSSALITPENKTRKKEIITRFSGYGFADVKRVLACAEQRGVIIGCGEIREKEIHEYRFPLPFSLSGQKHWRRMVITLAWFTPINPFHRNLREAKLEFKPALKWGEQPLKLKRTAFNWHQVQKGTVQHEVLESRKEISSFKDGDAILIHVSCKGDATERLDDIIPYGLAVSLEVTEGVAIPIYQQLRTMIRPSRIKG